MKIFNKCVHKWQLMSETILPSGWEQATSNLSISDIQRVKAPPEMFIKIVVIVLACEKCGKVKTIRENN